MRNELEGLLHTTKTGDQVVGVDEFLDYMLSKWCAMVSTQREQLAVLFEAVDDDGDCQLSLTEFTRVVDAVIPAASQTEVLELYKSCLARSAEIREENANISKDDQDGGSMDAIELDAFLAVILPHLLQIQSAADA